ncbi:HAMP domain-containing histidine kinase [Roseateles sp. DAIF2]|nr:HAMP domain-containing histidine kinase [Roseateles sp. DAIF2]
MPDINPPPTRSAHPLEGGTADGPAEPDPRRSLGNAPPGNPRLFDEAQSRRLAEAALRSITLSTSRVQGEAFFRVLVRDLAAALDVAYVIAGRLVTMEEDGSEGIQTLAVWGGADWLPNLAYSLKGTPCSNVAEQSMCFYPCGVQQAYPDDLLLGEMGAQSYVGTPMVGTTGQSLGILVALDKREIDADKHLLALSLLSIFAARGAAELQHQDRAAELEREVHARTEELRLATTALVEREKLAALGGLVAGVAHEVNTPIGIAVTAASGMEEFARELSRKLDGDKVSRSELQQLARRLQSAATLVGSNLARAAALVGGFKTLAVDQGSESAQQLDLPDYLRAIVQAHQPVLKSAQVQVQLTLPDELRLRLVGGLLSQILSNLLLNAITHAFDEAQTDRRIAIGLCELGETLELRVRDNGRGVPAEIRPRLFEPFFTTKRDAGGSGLGLHIVQTLVQRLGGTVRLDEAAGPGLGFIIRLPRETPHF